MTNCSFKTPDLVLYNLEPYNMIRIPNVPT